MICPSCRSATDVLDSRPTSRSVRRRRECRKCKLRVTTFESPLNLVDMLEKLRRRMRNLETEVVDVVECIRDYTSGKRTRPKRGRSRDRKVPATLTRRRRYSDDEVQRISAAYAESPADVVGVAFGRSAAAIRRLMSERGIVKTARRVTNGEHRTHSG